MRTRRARLLTARRASAVGVIRAAGLRWAVPLTVVLTAAAVPPAEAATIVIPDACNVLIMHPGTYRVVTAKMGCTDTAIQVQASNVVVDLGGRALRPGANSAFGILVGATRRNVVVKNGTIAGYQGGVSGAAGATFRNIIVRGAQKNFEASHVLGSVSVDGAEVGFFMHEGGSIRKSFAVSNDLDGISSDGNVLMTGNNVVANGSSGIAGNEDSIIAGNLVAANTQIGITQGGGGRIESNRVFGNGNGGIGANTSPVFANVVRGNSAGGIALGGNGRAAGNTVTGNVVGMFGQQGAVFKENVSNGNLGSGIVSPFDVQVSRNVTDGNNDFGIDVGANSSGGGNKAIENGSGDCVPDLCGGHAPSKGTPITIDCNIGPTPIDNPGTYRLVTSVSNCQASAAIEINASNVTLDLGGRTIDGDGGDFGISVGSGRTNVVVQNGTVTDWLAGVVILGAGSVARRIVARNNAIGVAADEGAAVDRSVSVANATGVNLTGDGSTVMRSTIAGNTANGVTSTGGKVRVLANKIIGNAGDGTNTSDGSLVRGNFVLGNFGDGIVATKDGRVEKNRLIANEGYGISLGSGNAVVRNVARGNGITGIIAGNQTTTVGNVTTGNIGGINVGNGSRIKENVAIGNIFTGIMTGNDSVFIRNNSTGNSGDGYFFGSNITGSGNKGKFNGGATQCPPSIC